MKVSQTPHLGQSVSLGILLVLMSVSVTVLMVIQSGNLP